jgi:hypothetical protein
VLWLQAGPAFHGALEHWHYDTFRVTWQDPMLGTSFVSFNLDTRGGPETMEVERLARFERVSTPHSRD